MDPRATWFHDTRDLLLIAVGLNLLSSGLVAFSLYSWAQECASQVVAGCFSAAAPQVWFWLALTVCGELPLLGLSGPRLAPIGTVSQATLLFLVPWGVAFGIPFAAWVFSFFAILGGLFGLWGSARAYGDGLPRPPLTMTLGGATWAGLTAVWLAYSPTLSPLFGECYSALAPTLCGTSVGTIPALAAVTIVALLLGTAGALMPVGRARYWPIGAAGGIGVIAAGFVLPPLLLPIVFFTTCAGSALAVAAFLYAPFQRIRTTPIRFPDGTSVGR